MAEVNGGPKISIVTISYNQSQYLEQCIASIARQDYKNIQHIVIDGGSSDGSIPLLEKHGKKELDYEFYWVSEKDEGPADALNKGFDIASGDVLGFINSDDMLCNSSLSKVIKNWKKDETEMLQGSGVIIDEGSNVTRVVSSVPLTLDAYLSGKGIIFQPSMFFSKEVYDKVGGFNINNKTCWDAEFFVECLNSGYTFQWCPHILSAFRFYSESKSGSGVDSNIIDQDRNRIKRNAYKSSSGFLFSVLRKFIYQLMSQPWVAFESKACVIRDS